MKVLGVVLRQFLCPGVKNHIAPATVVNGKLNAKRKQRGTDAIVFTATACCDRRIAVGCALGAKDLPMGRSPGDPVRAQGNQFPIRCLHRVLFHSGVGQKRGSPICLPAGLMAGGAQILGS